MVVNRDLSFGNSFGRPGPNDLRIKKQYFLPEAQSSGLSWQLLPE